MPNTELLGFSRSPNPAASSSLKPASLGTFASACEESAGGGAAKAGELDQSAPRSMRWVDALSRANGL